jgi:hypothetical protein
MYEEEDDDLPHHYRCLTAHLQTHSTDFNQRLSAYLTNHVAMRSALDQALRDSYTTQAAQQAGQAQNPYSTPASIMNAHMSYQAQMLGDSQPPPYIMQNMMPPMPTAMPTTMPLSPTHLQQQQFQNFDPQPRLTHSLQRQRCQRQSQNHFASESKSLQSVLKSPSPVITKPERGMSMPVEIKSESPPLQSIEQPHTPISMKSLTPQPQHQKRPEAPDLDSSESSQCGGLSYDKAYLPQCSMQAENSEFNPFATATPQDDVLYDSNLGFSNDPLMGMFMAGSDALNAPLSFDSSLQNSYSGTPAGKLELDTKTHVGGLDSTVGGGIAPAQLESTAMKRGFNAMPGIPERLKDAMAGTASTSASGTPGIPADKWNEWIEPREWEGAVQ